MYCAVRTGSLYIILRSAHTVYLCVLCGSENKQRLLPYTSTDFYNRDGDCLLRGRTESILNTLPYLRKLVPGLSPRRPSFDSRPGRVKFVMGKQALGQVFHRLIRFPLPLSFHHCSIIIFVHALLLTEGQTDEAWERSKQAMLFRKSESIGRKTI